MEQVETLGSDEESFSNSSSSILTSASKQSILYADTTCNWKIGNDKSLNECVSTMLLSEAEDKTSLEDVVSLETCIALTADPSGEACRIEFKMLNQQKIARVAVVSEASVLEFFKQSGEYATTVFAEFVDEFQDHMVYFAEASIQPPSTEASVKLTRTMSKNSSIWVYGIKLILTEDLAKPQKSGFNMDYLNDYLSNSNDARSEKAKKFLTSFARIENNSGGFNQILNNMGSLFPNFEKMSINSQSQELIENNEKELSNGKSSDKVQKNNINECNGGPEDMSIIKNYIDEKLNSFEARLMNRVESLERDINKKLDLILQKLADSNTR
ncbi:hypothetical protein TKK_0007368 [Trichogramma kaykai]|uniref:Uncharacterized protein n=1 Tax=Trichogramma kaykai TaxID=54128 RepID=A0ABD2WGX1_9HYME